MEQPPFIRMLIEVTEEAHPLAGSVTAGDQRVIPFRGWLELAAAIERVRLRHPDAETIDRTEPADEP